jgi:hypothetical protein
MNYRNRPLLDLARGQPCQMRVSGVCIGGTETTVSAHSNQARHGHGKGVKAADPFVAESCVACHTWLDSGPATRAEKEAAWQLGFERTLVARFERLDYAVSGYAPLRDPPFKPLDKVLARRASR